VTVRSAGNDKIVLEDRCPVEDAEALLQLLQSRAPTEVDWTRCSHLHTAVLQVILASGSVPLGPCGDTWVRQWVAISLPQQRFDC
jgi:hypothetical protein